MLTYGGGRRHQLADDNDDVIYPGLVIMYVINNLQMSKMFDTIYWDLIFNDFTYYYII